MTDIQHHHSRDLRRPVTCRFTDHPSGAEPMASNQPLFNEGLTRCYTDITSDLRSVRKEQNNRTISHIPREIVKKPQSILPLEEEATNRQPDALETIFPTYSILTFKYSAPHEQSPPIKDTAADVYNATTMDWGSDSDGDNDMFMFASGPDLLNRRYGATLDYTTNKHKRSTDWDHLTIGAQWAVLRILNDHYTFNDVTSSLLSLDTRQVQDFLAVYISENRVWEAYEQKMSIIPWQDHISQASSTNTLISDHLNCRRPHLSTDRVSREDITKAREFLNKKGLGKYVAELDGWIGLSNGDFVELDIDLARLEEIGSLIGSKVVDGRLNIEIIKAKADELATRLTRTTERGCSADPPLLLEAHSQFSAEPIIELGSNSTNKPNVLHASKSLEANRRQEQTETRSTINHKPQKRQYRGASRGAGYVSMSQNDGSSQSRDQISLESILPAFQRRPEVKAAISGGISAGYHAWASRAAVGRSLDNGYNENSGPNSEAKPQPTCGSTSLAPAAPQLMAAQAETNDGDEVVVEKHGDVILVHDESSYPDYVPPALPASYTDTTASQELRHALDTSFAAYLKTAPKSSNQTQKQNEGPQEDLDEEPVPLLEKEAKDDFEYTPAKFENKRRGLAQKKLPASKKRRRGSDQPADGTDVTTLSVEPDANYSPSEDGIIPAKSTTDHHGREGSAENITSDNIHSMRKRKRTSSGNSSTPRTTTESLFGMYKHAVLPSNRGRVDASFYSWSADQAMFAAVAVKARYAQKADRIMFAPTEGDPKANTQMKGDEVKKAMKALQNEFNIAEHCARGEAAQDAEKTKFAGCADWAEYAAEAEVALFAFEVLGNWTAVGNDGDEQTTAGAGSDAHVGNRTICTDAKSLNHSALHGSRHDAPKG